MNSTLQSVDFSESSLFLAKIMFKSEEFSFITFL